MKRLLLGTLSLLVLLTGCTTIPFQEAKQDQPHATLNFQSLMGIGNAIRVDEINGKPPSAWKLMLHRFLVPPGEITLLLSTCQTYKFGYTASAVVKIEIEDNRVYNFEREIKKDAVVLLITRDDGYVVYRENMSLDPGHCN